MSLAFEASPTDDAIPLVVTINRPGQGGVTGESPTVALRDAETADSYLDWDDFTFKTAGWASKDGAMVEVGGGHYQRTLDAGAAPEIVAGMQIIAEYVNTGLGVAGAGHDVIVFRTPPLIPSGS